MLDRISLSLVLAPTFALAAGCAAAPVPPVHSATPIIESDAPTPAAAAVHVSASAETEIVETGSAEAADDATAGPDRETEVEPEPPTAAQNAPEPMTEPAPHHAPESVAADATEAPDAPPAPPWDPDAPVRFAPDVEAHVRAIARRVPRRDDAAFVKVGDSATVSRIYLRCLGDDDAVRLDGRRELQPILERFRGGAARGGDPFARESLAAGVGWSANRPLRGSPTPLAREVRAMNPRFALVMFGSNDLELGRLGRYESRMTALVDRLLGWGVVPVLSTIPQRNDDAEADGDVPRYNRVVRALAAARRLPLIDLNRALASLPDRGLASDGVHPGAPVVDGRAHGCDFTEAGLQHGMNVRNLLTLRVLGRLAEVVSEGPETH